MSMSQGGSINSDLYQDDDQTEQLLSKYRTQARNIISNLDCQVEKNRFVLAKSYRRVNKMIDELDKDKFNLNEDPNLLDDILKTSFFCRAWDLTNPNLKYLSSFCKEAVKGNRRLKTPCIQIEEEIIGANQKYVKLNSNKQEFTLKIQAEPYSSVLYTNKPNTHPMLMKEGNATYFLKYGEKQILDILTPPCEINVVAFNDSKIQSKVVSLKVTSQINQGQLRQNNMGYAIRPVETFPFEESAFGSSQSASFSNAPEYPYEENAND